jgi:hypothetical protein
MSSLKDIDPTNLRDYLKSIGWQVVDAALDDDLYLLRNQSNAGRELVFPTQKSAPDYLDAVSIVLEKLQSITGIKADSIATRVAAVKDDVLRLRIHSDVQDDSLSLDFAANFLKNTEKLFKSAACTVLRPRANHPRLTLSEATQLVEKTRFGQTEAGSFILNVSCPIYAMDVQGTLQLSDDEAPFVRKVFSAIQESMERLVRAIKADTIEALVEETKKSDTPLISSNFCEALAAMQDERTYNAVDALFSWSHLRPRADDRSSKPISFQRDYFSRIEELRRELRAVEDNDIEVYIGTVERLEGEMGSDGKRSGNVVLSLLLPEEEETVRARVILNAADYATADQAHMTNGAYVRVKGRLLPGRQPRQLADFSEFEMLNR